MGKLFLGFGSVILLGLTLFSSCAIPPSCALRLTPSSLSVRKGESATFLANADTGCNPSVATTISVDNPSSFPFVVSFDPSQGAVTLSTGKVTVNSDAPFGTYTVTVRVSNNGQSVGAALQVTVLQ